MSNSTFLLKIASTWFVNAIMNFMLVFPFQRPDFFKNDVASGGIYEFRADQYDIEQLTIWVLKISFYPRSGSGVLFYGEDGENYMLLQLVDYRLTAIFKDESSNYENICEANTFLDAILHKAWNTAELGLTNKNGRAYAIRISFRGSAIDCPLNSISTRFWSNLFVGGVLPDSKAVERLSKTHTIKSFNGAFFYLEFSNVNHTVKLIDGNRARNFSKIMRYYANVREYDGFPCDHDECIMGRSCVVARLTLESSLCISCPKKCDDESYCMRHFSSPWCICVEGLPEHSEGDEQCKVMSICEDESKCVHGLCYASGETFKCLCEGHFTGDDCSKCVGTSGCDHGSCQMFESDNYNYLKCVCHSGYGRPNCDVLLTNMGACLSIPCQNGVCTDMEKAFSCECQDGFTGYNCESEIELDICSSQPCQFGKCTDNKSHYICSCNVGFHGYNCQLENNECLSEPCINGACNELTNAFSCLCNEGYTGIQCETAIDVCNSQLCVHGECENFPNSFNCSCLPGYGGVLCELEHDECASQPCRYGECVNEINRYICSCDSDYTGAQCESDVDECGSHACKHGSCVDAGSGYACVCEPGYTSAACDVQVEHCDSDSCQHGKCTSDNDERKVVCRCSEGFTGEWCQTSVDEDDADDDECVSEPCVNGECRDGDNHFTCLCSSGTFGEICDQEFDACQSSPCKFGNCLNNQSGFACSCPNGFTGEQCSIPADLCAVVECNSTDNCSNHHSETECRCLLDDNTDGLSCMKVSEICSGNPCRDTITPVLGDGCFETVYHGFPCACKRYIPVEQCKPSPLKLRCQTNNCNREDGIKNNFEPLVYELMCEKHCGETISTNSTSWSLSINGEETRFIRDYVLEEPTDNSISLNSGAFLVGTNYSLIASVNYRDFSVWTGDASFSMIQPPPNLTCAIDPISGFDAETLFTVACIGWADLVEESTIPLSAHFEHRSVHLRYDGEHQRHLHSVNSNQTQEIQFEASLSAGEESLEYITQMLVTVRDDLGQESTSVVKVTVKRSQNKTAVDSFLKAYLYTSRGNMTLGNMVQLTSFLEAHNETEKTTVKQVIDSIVNGLANINMTNLHELEDGFNVAGYVLESSSELLSRKQFSDVSETMRTMGDVFSDQSNSLDFDDKLDISGAFVYATSGLMQSLNTIVSSDNLTSTDVKYAHSANRDTLNLIEDTLAGVSDSLAVEDEPLAINATDMSVYLTKFQDDKLKSSNIDTQQGSVALPDVETNTTGDCFKMITSFFKNDPHWILNDPFVTRDDPSVKFVVEPCEGPKTNRQKRWVASMIGALARGYVVKMIKPPLEDITAGVEILNQTLDTPTEFVFHTINIDAKKSAKLLIYPISDDYLDVFLGFGFSPSEKNFSQYHILPHNDSNQITLSSANLNDGKLQEIIVAVRKTCATFRKDSSTSNCTNQMTYKYVFGSSQCSVWDEEKRTWMKNDDCELLEDTEDSVKIKPGIFGTVRSILIIPPNTIDFHAVFSNFGERVSKNYDVIVVMSVVMVVFFEGLIFLRRRDNLDHARWKSIITDGTTETDKYKYEVHIHTMDAVNAGVECLVDINIHGSISTSGYITLVNSKREEVEFYRGGTKGFLISTLNFLGVPDEIEVLVYSYSQRPLKWKLNLIVVVDMKTYEWFPFVHRKEISTDGNGKHHLELERLNPTSDKTVLMKRNLRNMCINTHGWISTFYRTIKTTFTRVQRWICSFFAVTMLMLCNALWFDTSFGENAVKVSIGAWDIPVQAFVKTLYTTFIVTFATSILSYLYTVTKISKGEESMHYMTYAPISQLRNKTFLPHFTIYITHLVAILGIMIAATMCILFSLQWGNETARIWLVTFIFGFLLNVLVLQPLQIFFVVGSMTYRGSVDSDLLMYRTFFPNKK